MGQINTREIVLFSGTTTTTGQGPDINLIQGWQSAIVTLQLLTVSGTTPTLNVVVQNKLGQPSFGTDTSGLLPTGTAIYDDYLGFTQLTTSNTTKIMRVCTGPLTPSANATVVTSADYTTISNGTITASNLRIGPIGGQWRVYYTIGGTSPSFAFSVTAQLIPFST